MPSTCSYCKKTGHNIRKCDHPDIQRLFHSMVIEFVLPKIGSSFTQTDRDVFSGFMNRTYSGHTIHAATARLTRLGSYGNATYKIQLNICRLCSQVSEELERLNGLSEPERQSWIDEFHAGQSHENSLDPDSVSFIEDRQGTPIPINPRYPVILSILAIDTTQQVVECAICQEEIDGGLLDTTNCGHSFCHNCICCHIDSKNNTDTVDCPLCRAKITSLATPKEENCADLAKRFSLTGAILKDCSLMAYGDPMWAWRSHEQTMEMFLEEYASKKKLIADIHAAKSVLEKSETLWRYLWTKC